MVAPYGWIANVSTDLNSGEPPAGTDSDFSDIVAKIDGGFEAHLEGQGDEWGMFADFSWVSLGDDNERRLSHTESDLDVYLVEAAAVWSPGDTRNQGWELFAGLRYIDLNLEIDVDPVGTVQRTRPGVISATAPETGSSRVRVSNGRSPITSWSRGRRLGAIRSRTSIRGVSRS